jgi:hypothetical protein
MWIESMVLKKIHITDFIPQTIIPSSPPLVVARLPDAGADLT